ncbi:MAG TPA: OsmC family protein [Bacteroidales bacterium]|nr:OsmC family protein [Bacteroidales bacterium]
MSTNKVDVVWTGEMSFEADVNGFKLAMDADEKVGGQNKGPRPKPLTLASLGGCTAMDVISILRKMRVEPDWFNVEVEGDLTEEHPKYYHTIRVTYMFKGENLEMEKLQKAVELSNERYCGVNALLRKGAVIEHKIVVL